MGALKKPSVEELTELKRWGDHPVVVRYLQSALQDTKDALVATPDIDTIRVLQGQAQALKDLLKFVSM